MFTFIGRATGLRWAARKRRGKAEKSENWESVTKGGPSIGIPKMIEQ